MESHRKGFLKLNCFCPLKILTSSLFKETLVTFLSLSLFFYAPSLEDLGFLIIFEEEITSSKLFFKWLQYTYGERIFQNGVMNVNMAKP
jgi:hypothetical protein